jgi:tetratricopeptide (TPR) repeat protein
MDYLEIDEDGGRSVRFAGRESVLSPLRFRLVKSLNEARGSYIEKKELLKLVYENTYSHDEEWGLARLNDLAHETRQHLKRSGLPITIDGSRSGFYALKKLHEDTPTELAATLGARYMAGETDAAIRELVKQYVVLHGHPTSANSCDFAKSFVHAVKGKLEPRHVAVTELLSMGLPVNPVHFAGLARPNVERLATQPAYAALIKGIRRTELDYELAYDELKSARSADRDWFAGCALADYTSAQCARKLGHFQEALAFYKHSIRRIADWRSDRCPCSGTCCAADMRVEAHRGAGVVYRRLGQWEEAEAEFAAALEICREENAAVSDKVQADLMYSYGYMRFEHARLHYARDPALRSRYRDCLHEALNLFEHAHKKNDRWCAPLARSGMVKSLLGLPAVETYGACRSVASGEHGVEASLSAVLAGFGMLLDGKRHLDVKNGRALLEELWSIFEQDTLVAKGARECHAFDIDALYESRGNVTDPDLAAVHGFMQDSAKWECFDVAEQRSKVEDYRTRRS